MPTDSGVKVGLIDQGKNVLYIFYSCVRMWENTGMDIAKTYKNKILMAICFLTSFNF